jgi:hypothetical protein
MMDDAVQRTEGGKDILGFVGLIIRPAIHRSGTCALPPSPSLRFVPDNGCNATHATGDSKVSLDNNPELSAVAAVSRG